MSTYTPANMTETTRRNIDQAFDFLRAIGEDPSLLHEIPEGSAVVLIPRNEPDLAETNIEIAMHIARRGHNVYIKQAD